MRLGWLARASFSLSPPLAGIRMMSTDTALRMTADERFLFDLNGFLHLKGVMSAEEVAAANAAVDAHQSGLNARDTKALYAAAPPRAFCSLS